jgi:hypothetical protein
VSWIERWSRLELAIGMAIVFGVTRVVARISGVFFDTSALQASWQHLDVELLRERLAESLFYQHSQPPLFNLFLGGVLKVAGASHALAFQVLFLAMGFALYVTLFVTMQRLGISRAVAFVAASLFAVSPSYILYESWLHYTLPLALLVGLAALCLARLLERRDALSALLFFLSVGMLCMTHGIFHLVFLLGCIVLLLMRRDMPKRVVIAGALLPLVLLVALYVKNAVVFGQFGTSTWMGMNVALRRVEALPMPERDRLVRDGAISPVSLVTPFDPLDRFPSGFAVVPERFAHVPALTEARKADGNPNLNHAGYIAISKQYAADTKFVLTHYPKILVVSLFRGWWEYFRSSSDYWFLAPNLQASTLMRVYNRAFDLLVYGAPAPKLVGVLLVIAIPLLVVATLRAVYRGASGGEPLSRERRALLGFCAATIAFVAVTANTLNALENMRIRFMTDPLVVILAAFWAERWALPRIFAWRERRRARAAC